MSGRVVDKVVVVTGAGRGQGAAEARLLAAEGATVIAVDLTPQPIEDIGGAEYRQLDVTDAAGWASLAAVARKRFGHIDGLVANAGITWRARLTDLQPADLARVSEVNVTGTLLGIQALTPLMAAGGSIVIVGSVAALTGHYPVAYTASKWALRGMAKAACLELGRRGIRVNTIHPGYIETPMTASAPSTFRDANVAETPLGRTGTVDEVAPLVVWVCQTNGVTRVVGDLLAAGGQAAVEGDVEGVQCWLPAD